VTESRAKFGPRIFFFWFKNAFSIGTGIWIGEKSITDPELLYFLKAANRFFIASEQAELLHIGEIEGIQKICV
jgi:hypothetical protein